MAKSERLGKGLGALLDGQTTTPGAVGKRGETPTPPVKSELVKEIPLSEIEPNPQQPRTSFDEDSLGELADSIRQLGIIQPITVRAVDKNRYQIISGERRYRASKQLGYETIPAYVREANDNDSLLMALIENIQRTDLDAIEIALSYQLLVDQLHHTQEEISEKVGQKRSTVANYLRLLKLPEEIQLAIREQLITMGHARALINVSGVTQQVSIAKKIVDQGLSVRQVEELVKSLGKPKAEKPQPTGDGEAGGEDKSELFFKLVERMERCFSGKVNIKRGSNGGAKLTVELKTDDDIRSAVERLSALVGEKPEKLHTWN
ncbi:MAG: ParB/RepB/Spo0J family partition protein [Prevotellaceae bacterium]|jgi:ParB family chromosome partitioning protein|nr:ParB/RepB/Spo0J family partition protein [Prevotellaceae bacterium]